jgi:hypothetical protein
MCGNSVPRWLSRRENAIVIESFERHKEDQDWSGKKGSDMNKASKIAFNQSHAGKGRGLDVRIPLP